MNLREAIKERRSIRKYENKEIPADLLKEILEDALWAPSGTNRQKWEIIAVRGEKKDALLEVIAETVKYLKPRLEKIFPEKMVKITLQFFKNLGGAPVVLLVYIPKNIPELHPDMSGLERHQREYDRFTTLLSASALSFYSPKKKG